MAQTYTDEEILAAYRKHGLQVKAAEALGISKKKVAKAVRNAGLATGVKKGQFWAYEEEMIRLYYEGWTQEQLAEKYGAQNIDTIGKILRKRGVKTRKPGGYVGEKNPQWKGGKSRNRKPQYRGKYQARKTFERILGKKLGAGWVVHHQDENPDNNAAENLWIFPDNSAHLRYHQQQLALRFELDSEEATQALLKNGAVSLLSLAALKQESPDKVQPYLCDKPLDSTASPKAS